MDFVYQQHDLDWKPEFKSRRGEVFFLFDVQPVRDLPFIYEHYFSCKHLLAPNTPETSETRKINRNDARSIAEVYAKFRDEFPMNSTIVAYGTRFVADICLGLETFVCNGHISNTLDALFGMENFQNLEPEITNLNHSLDTHKMFRNIFHNSNGEHNELKRKALKALYELKFGIE